MANEFQSFVDKWSKVGGQAGALGVPNAAMAPIIQADKQKMLTGGTPLTPENALLEVVQSSGLRPGQQIFKQRQTGPGWNPEHWIGNAVKDVGSIATGLNPIHLVPALLKQVEQAPQIPQDVTHALGEHSAGAAIRDLAQTPLLRLVPGLTTAAELTSPQGRLQIENHPLQAFLDVLPYGDLTAEQLLGHQEGLFDLMGSKVPQAARDSWNQMWDRMGLGKNVRNLSQKYNVVNRDLGDAVRGVRDQTASALKGLTPEDKQRVFTVARSGDPTKLADLPEHLAVSVRALQSTDKYVQSLQVADGTVFGVEVPGIGTELYQARGTTAQATVVRFYKKKLDLERQLSAATDAVANAKGDAAAGTAMAKLNALQRRIEQNTSDFLVAVRETPPERFRAVIQDQAAMDLRNTIAQDASTTSDQRLQALQAIDRGDISGGLKAAGLNDEVYRQYLQEESRTWQQMATNGFRPVTARVMDSGTILGMVRPSVTLGKVPKVDVAMQSAFDFGNHVSDLELELSDAQIERIVASHSQAALDWMKAQPYVRTRDQLITEMMDKGVPEAKDARISQRALVDAMLREQGWVEWDPASMVPFRQPGSANILPSGETLMIPDYMKRAMDQLSGKIGGQNPIAKLSQKGLRIFRNSVLLFSPSAYVHIVFGSLAMVLGETGPSALRYVGDAWQMAKDGTLPAEVARGAMDVPQEDKVWSHLAGRQLGDLYASGVKHRFGVEGHPIAKIEEVAQHFRNTMGDFSRSLAYLYGKGKRDADYGVELANKAMANWDRMTPIERTVIRQVFPFYGWISHVMRYVFTYPVDHPLRASIVSKLATTENTDWRAGLPQSLQALFFLGAPDKNGNVSAVNLKSLNPFRDVANYLTLAGFVSSLNPALASVVEALGIRLPSGTPDLYPNLTVDPLTGKLEAQRQDVFPLLLSNFIPETDAIKGFFGWSSRLRGLRQSDPSAYRQQLANALGFPWLPRQYSIPQQEGSFLIAREKVAQADLSHALKSGDWSSATRWALVPYQGKLVDPRQMESLVKLLQQGVKRSTGQSLPGDVVLNNLPSGYVPSLLSTGLSAANL